MPPSGDQIGADAPRADQHLIDVFRTRRYLCRACPTPCNPLPRMADLTFKCPLDRWPAIDLPSSGLGDWVERFAKPIARALRLDCLDKEGQLKPESGCAKRRYALNKMFSTNAK